MYPWRKGKKSSQKNVSILHIYCVVHLDYIAITFGILVSLQSDRGDTGMNQIYVLICENVEHKTL